jgi:hypothetical protein
MVAEMLAARVEKCTSRRYKRRMEEFKVWIRQQAVKEGDTEMDARLRGYLVRADRAPESTGVWAHDWEASQAGPQFFIEMT